MWGSRWPSGAGSSAAPAPTGAGVVRGQPGRRGISGELRLAVSDTESTHQGFTVKVRLKKVLSALVPGFIVAIPLLTADRWYTVDPDLRGVVLREDGVPLLFDAYFAGAR